ncbi:hypothetical protein [Pseudomonas sp. R2-37-08W]|uniref:hypothetical protein n=1 Tax=Pseudomonas sp. R2-37-08W TaxID=1173273 RepID=UPI000F5893D7|nr:hypothetical protein [Pseudomonas sp. R2-37-08W]
MRIRAVPRTKRQSVSKKNEQKPPEASDSIRSSTYEQAANKALDWLLENNFRAENPTPGRFGPHKGEPIGMQTADGKTGYRVEHDDKSGADINVWSAKKKGPHYLFEASPKTVLKLTKRFAKK